MTVLQESRKSAGDGWQAKIADQETESMDELDRIIINELQENFPLQANPYEILAGNLRIPVERLWTRIQTLVESGVIRRIGFSIDSRKMGYSSTLAAIRVLPERVEAVSELIATYPEITHGYLREDGYNIWFTVIAENKDRVWAVVEEIRLKLGLSGEDIMNLPVEKLFKLDARFK
jgi:DNA-binding Lrp family transcriptional regulator